MSDARGRLVAGWPLGFTNMTDRLYGNCIYTILKNNIHRHTRTQAAAGSIIHAQLVYNPAKYERLR